MSPTLRTSCRASFRASRASERGASLIITLVVILVLTLIALAAVNRGYVEVDSAGFKRRYAASVSCTEAARDLVVGQLVLAGTRFDNVQLVRQVGDLTLSTGHYDSASTGQVKLDSGSANCGVGGSSGGGTDDCTNTTTCKAVGSSCGVRIPVVCRDGSGRALELEFLVRIGI